MTSPPNCGTSSQKSQIAGRNHENLQPRSSHRHRLLRPYAHMRIMIVTDAWFPQTNGVVRTLAHTAAWLGRFGHEIRTLTPRDFRGIPCPTYPEISLPLFTGRRGRM